MTLQQVHDALTNISQLVRELRSLGYIVPRSLLDNIPRVAVRRLRAYLQCVLAPGVDAAKCATLSQACETFMSLLPTSPTRCVVNLEDIMLDESAPGFADWVRKSNRGSVWKTKVDQDAILKWKGLHKKLHAVI